MPNQPLLPRPGRAASAEEDPLRDCSTESGTGSAAEECSRGRSTEGDDAGGAGEDSSRDCPMEAGGPGAAVDGARSGATAGSLCDPEGPAAISLPQRGQK